MSFIYCFDPTANDSLSKVRGVGRYLQILKECFKDKWIFTDDLRITTDSIFVNPFYNFLQKPLSLRRVAKKQIAVIHDLIPLKYPEHFPVGVKGKFNIFLNKLALKKYDLIVTDSEASKKDINQILGIEESRVKVIYPTLPKVFSRNSILDNRYSGKKQISSIQYPISSFCLYVGDATWNKNLVNLAKAIKKINVTCVFAGKVFQRNSILENRYSEKSKNPNIQYPISNININNPWQKELNQFFKETGDDKRFIFLGYVPDLELIQLYQKAKCNILVSRDEGFGFSYLEAASQSCPSILSDTDIFQEISDKQGALFANPDNIHDIANAIGEVYFNQDLRNKLGKEAEKRSKFFSQKKFISEINKILNFLTFGFI